MKRRFKLFSSQILLISLLLLLCAIGSMVIFMVAAHPFAGDRIHENIGKIFAWGIPAAMLFTLILCTVGAMVLMSMANRHFLMPLRRLRSAAAAIRDGNLDHNLVCSGNDEFTEVNRSFEEMRIRLKDSIYQMELAQRERSAMLACICHDLKTPITSILGYSEGLLDGVVDSPERMLEYVRVIRRKAEGLRILADDLSLMGQLENTQLPLQLTPEDAGKFVSAIAQEFTAETPHMRLTETHHSQVVCNIDRDKLGRVLVNVLQNSVKYKKPETLAPTIHVEVTEADNKALITIADDGIGIPANSLPHVYERFYRADASRGVAGGSGLGLAIAWQIVNLHGGKTWVRSKEGAGTTICILLPLSEPKTPEPKRRGKKKAGGGKRP